MVAAGSFDCWPVVFAKTKTTMKVKPTCNMIRTFSVFGKYISHNTIEHDKMYL